MLGGLYRICGGFGFLFGSFQSRRGHRDVLSAENVRKYRACCPRDSFLALWVGDGKTGNCCRPSSIP
jgi:hypothetical protein